MADILDRLAPTSYSFLARVRPVLFVSVPLALAIWTWTAGELSGTSWLLSFAVAAGLPYMLGEKAADAGRSREPTLWASWGGPPTTRFLRHADSPLNQHTHARIHNQLAAVCPDLHLPSRAEEEADPESADSVYGSCVDRIRVLAREDPMLLKASIGYGFRRNLWAIRPWGIVAGVGGIAAGSAHIIVHGVTLQASLTVTVSFILLLVLIFVVTPAWIAAAGEIYARRLVEWLENHMREPA